MQNDERTPAANFSSKDLTTCSCSACFPRKDFRSDASLVPHHPRELYNHNSRLVGFPAHIPILPYAPITSSPASLFAPLHLHRPSYPRATFPVPDDRFNLPVLQDTTKESALLETRQIVQSQPLQPPNSEATGNYWEQSSGEYMRLMI